MMYRIRYGVKGIGPSYSPYVEAKNYVAAFKEGRDRAIKLHEELEGVLPSLTSKKEHESKYYLKKLYDEIYCTVEKVEEEGC